MLPTIGVTTKAYAATSTWLPGVVVVAGALLLLKLGAFKSLRDNHQARHQADKKRAELEKKLEALQGENDALKAAQQSAAETSPSQAANTTNTNATFTAQSPANHSLFEQVINENIAMRGAADD